MDTSVLEKRCGGCHEVKPATAFHRNSSRRAVGGLQSECKECAKCRQAWYKLNPMRGQLRPKHGPPTPDQTKRCNGCGETKPLAEFYPDGGNGGLYGVRTRCKVCNLAYQTAHPRPYDPNRPYYPETNRVIKLRRKFNLTVAQYDEMVAAQGGVCALCDRPERVKDKRNGVLRNLTVDHCHATGRIRALLCLECNLMLGKIEDNPIILDRARDYIARYA